ncbi:hypothetical protein VaNZ11_010646 [Volvox africanus]|uniref:Uncharacterized protein n=1 Tax=Volvox africanus TaxID=51714 RepID=A0ABQ5SAX4_9CHLO|nr:hypothetical protein VaNZ11_010646 [Volvox africanus]
MNQKETETNRLSFSDPANLFNLRERSHIPNGHSIYIQAGDTSDFDGYLIAAAGEVLQARTKQFDFVIAVPERRVWLDKNEPDLTKHDPSYSEEVMATGGAMLRHLCPRACLIRGPLNQRNVIPWKMMFNEPERYGPLLQGLKTVDVRWTALKALAERILNPQVSSVILDMNGSVGYLDSLVKILQQDGEKVLGQKLRASGRPIVIMAGVQAEVTPQTLPLPGRDPRSTSNAIYHPDGVRVLLRLARQYSVPLLFVTNNICNQLLKFQDAGEVLEQLLGLREGDGSLLRRISDTWFGMAHLKGKCVPFDWVAFAAMLLYDRAPTTMRVVQQELWVGRNDPSVLVLRDTSNQQQNDVVMKNLAGTELYGVVSSVSYIDHEIMIALAKYAVATHSKYVSSST